MIRFGEHKNINFSKFLPEWLMAEEYADIIKVFENTFNELYETKISLTKTNEINIKALSFKQTPDSENILWKWGSNTAWPNDKGKYRDTTPAAGTDIKFPNIVYGPETLSDYPFSYLEPLNIHPINTNQVSGTFLSYSKKGLYQVGSNINFNLPISNDFFTSDNNTTETQAISVLEKIFKLLDLKDPNLIDFDYLGYFADHIGYDMKLNMFSFEDSTVTHTKFLSMIDAKEKVLQEQGIITKLSYIEREALYNVIVGKLSSHTVITDYHLDRKLIESVKKEFIELQVRAIIENLPYWYKIKGTDDSIKILLYSFGLVSEIHNYYTKNYSVKLKDWDSGNVFYNTSNLKTSANNVNTLTEDLSDIPNDWYTTPHFKIRFDYNLSWSYMADNNIMSDMGKFGKMIDSISAAKPINAVFKGLAGIFRTKTLNKLFVTSNVRVHKIEIAKLRANTKMSEHTIMAFPLINDLIVSNIQPEQDPKKYIDQIINITDVDKYHMLNYMDTKTGDVSGDQLLGSFYSTSPESYCYNPSLTRKAWTYDNAILYKPGYITWKSSDSYSESVSDDKSLISSICENLEGEYETIYNDLPVLI